MTGARVPALAGSLCFLCGLLLAGGAGIAQQRANEHLLALRFQAVAADVGARVAARMRSFEFGLRGMRGVVVAQGGVPATEQVRRYGTSRDVEREFPGAHGFGLIWRVPRREEAAFVARMRADGQPAFALRQLAPHDGDRDVIAFVEPRERNLAALGLDIASEPRRRAAALAARASGRVAISEPITLVQDSGQALRSFLLLLPITEAALRGAPARAGAEVAGWSYAPVVIDEVLATLDLPEQLVWLSLRDAGTAPAEARFFASPGAEPLADGLPAVDLPIVMFDRRWIAHVRARPALVAELRLTPPWLVAAAGAFGAALLGGVAFLLAQRGQRMRRLQLERAERAAIVDASDDGIVGLRLDGTITGWNRGAERLFGFAAAEVLGKPIKTVLPRAEWLQEDTALHASLAAGKRVAPFETQRRHRDGTLLDVSVGAAPIHDAGGRLVAMAKTYRDIGASRAARNSLEELNLSLDRQVRARTESLDQALRDLRNIVDALPSMIGYWDGALRNRMANRAYAGWFGRAPQELAGRHMTELVAPDVYEMNRPHAEAALRGEPQAFQRTLPRPRGGTLHGLAHYLPDVVNGVVRGFYVLVHDVTELQEQRALLEAEKRDKAGLLAIIDTHMIVSTTDRDGVISAVNERFCRVSGYTAAELVGRTHRVVGSGTHPPAFWREMWRTIGTGAIWHGEVCNRARDGAPYWLDTVIAPFLDEHGRIEKIVAVRSDVSGRKRAELELRQALATLESILASATQVAIVATDLGGIVTLFNRGAECLLGYDAAEVTGRVDVLRWYLPDELEARRADLGLHGGAPAMPFQALTGDAAIDRPFDCHYRRKDGSLVPVTSSTARILDADRGLLGYIHVAYDRRRRPRS